MIQSIIDIIGRRSERFRALFFGSLAMVSSTIINSLTRVAIVAILARYYSKEEFGMWTAITAITAITVTGDFGITNALRNKLSYLSARGKSADSVAHEYYLSKFLSIFFELVCHLIISLTLRVLSETFV